MRFPLRLECAKENHSESGSSKQCNDQRTDQSTVFLAPIITDFVRNTKRDLYDEKLEDALEMLDLEWSKNDDTKTQCSRLKTSPLHRGNVSNKNGPARIKRRIQWEVPSKPLAVDDPLLLLEREVHTEIGINWFLDSSSSSRFSVNSMRAGLTVFRQKQRTQIYMDFRYIDPQARVLNYFYK